MGENSLCTTACPLISTQAAGLVVTNTQQAPSSINGPQLQQVNNNTLLDHLNQVCHPINANTGANTSNEDLSQEDLSTATIGPLAAQLGNYSQSEQQISSPFTGAAILCAGSPSHSSSSPTLSHTSSLGGTGSNYNSLIPSISPLGHSGLGSISSSQINHANNAAAMQSSADYLAQLLKDKKQLAAFPNVFVHLERLLDDEINRVRSNLFHVSGCEKKPLLLPEADGQVIAKSEKVYVPSKEHPEYNFVGRILGPRGMTAKQLEQETGCKIMVRGRGSMRDKKKEEANRGKPNWEHLSDELHVLITVEDSPNRAALKIQRAIEEVQKLLIPVMDGEDELKKRQLMELAIINGTYRDSSSKNGQMETDAIRHLMAGSPLSVQSLRQGPTTTIGAPLIISPRHLMASHHHHQMMNGSGGPPPLISAESAGLLYATPYEAFHHYAIATPQHHLLAEGYSQQGQSPGSEHSMNGTGHMIMATR